MSGRLSQGIRVYEHAPNGERFNRSSYNYYQGMNIIEELKDCKLFDVVGVGSESGAMVIHYRWRRIQRDVE